MGPRNRRRSICSVRLLTPLIEGPDPEAQRDKLKKEIPWDSIRTWLYNQMEKGRSSNHFSLSYHGNNTSKRMDLRLVIGVLGCPLAPIPITSEPYDHLSIKNTPIETSSARYIIQQYLAATGCLKIDKCMKSIYVAGNVKMACCETNGNSVRMESRGGGENGCFVLWQMSPGMWLVELVVAGNKVVAGNNGKTVWRSLPWLGTVAARGPQ